MILEHVARNVTDLDAAQKFYREALGCVPLGPIEQDSNLANILGAERVLSQRLRLGRQRVELTQCFPAGQPYPKPAQADDPFFQHIAIVTTDIATACTRALQAGAQPISQSGPQLLPAAAGGVTAWKFRDPDGHPLEFLQFPHRDVWHGDALFLGYDHSAICVADATRSIAYYQQLGLRLSGRQHNHGPAQNKLDGLAESRPEVITLSASSHPPHLELLAYRSNQKAAPRLAPKDIAADRLVFGNGTTPLSLVYDCDHHALLLAAPYNVTP